MFAAHHRLNNLTVIVDANGQQAFGLTRDVVEMANLAERWTTFGWSAEEVDGHSLEELRRGLAHRPDRARPRVLIAHTVFGKGVSYMEKGLANGRPNLSDAPVNWHYLPMSDEEFAIAMAEEPSLVRRAFIETLCSLAAADERILLLTGDLGYMALEPFRERFAARFFNVGVAEQNMIGIATGLAEAGFIPFAYSIAPSRPSGPSSSSATVPFLHRLAGSDRRHGGGLRLRACRSDAPRNSRTSACSADAPGTDASSFRPTAEQVTAALETTWNLPGPVYYSLVEGRPAPSSRVSTADSSSGVCR